MKPGMIAMWPTVTPPAGWLICNGDPIDPQFTDLIAIVGPNTPNMANKLLRGAGATAVKQQGGADQVTLDVAHIPAHSHGGTTGSEAAHTHGGTSGGMSKNATHGHSGSTQTENRTHQHREPQRATGNDTANHTHRITINEGVGEGADGNYLDSNPTADPGMTFDGGQASGGAVTHTHTVGARTTGANSADHAHSLAFDTLTTSPAGGMAHTHAFDMAAASAHGHTMSDSGNVSPASFPIVPVCAALYFVIKT